MRKWEQLGDLKLIVFAGVKEEEREGWSEKENSRKANKQTGDRKSRFFSWKGLGDG